jgi:hypothetical protein
MHLLVGVVSARIWAPVEEFGSHLCKGNRPHVFLKRTAGSTRRSGKGTCTYREEQNTAIPLLCAATWPSMNQRRQPDDRIAHPRACWPTWPHPVDGLIATSSRSWKFRSLGEIQRKHVHLKRNQDASAFKRTVAGRNSSSANACKCCVASFSSKAACTSASCTYMHEQGASPTSDAVRALLAHMLMLYNAGLDECAARNHLATRAKQIHANGSDVRTRELAAMLVPTCDGVGKWNILAAQIALWQEDGTPGGQL